MLVDVLILKLSTYVDEFRPFFLLETCHLHVRQITPLGVDLPFHLFSIFKADWRVRRLETEEHALSAEVMTVPHTDPFVGLWTDLVLTAGVFDIADSLFANGDRSQSFGVPPALSDGYLQMSGCDLHSKQKQCPPAHACR